MQGQQVKPTLTILELCKPGSSEIMLIPVNPLEMAKHTSRDSAIMLGLTLARFPHHAFKVI